MVVAQQGNNPINSNATALTQIGNVILKPERPHEFISRSIPTNFKMLNRVQHDCSVQHYQSLVQETLM